MKMHSATRTQVLVDILIEDLDPDDSTVEISIDGTYYPSTWVASAVKLPTGDNDPDVWKRTAQTNGFFAGPDATPAGAVVLALGPHPVETRVSKDGDVLTHESDTLVVYTV